MRTSGLIDAIAADAGAPRRRLTSAFWIAVAASAVAASLVFEAMLGPRPDIAAAAATPRFLWKFVATLSFGVAAATLALRLARPGADPAPGRAALIVAAALLAGSVAVELFVTPSGAWAAKMMGRNALLCLASVPALSALPLLVLLVAMRRGAPGSPAALGACAGLLAGAIGSTFYALHCFDDSPLFVALWYGLAVGAVTVVGAALGSRLLKW